MQEGATITKKGILLLAIAVVAMAIQVVAGGADEIEQVKQKTAQLEERISKLEAKEGSAIPDSMKWTENIYWTGDFRYRYGYIDKESSVVRNRNRIRARLGMGVDITDEWEAFFRIATGEKEIYASEGDDFDSPGSANQTLKKFFSGKDIWWDRAYFGFHPASVPNLDVYGGKVKMPFYCVGGNQLIWDSDLNPEGISTQYEYPIQKNTKLIANAGGFWIDESSSGVDASLWGIQGYVQHAIGNPDTLIAGASFFDYGNIQGKTDTYGLRGANARTGATWASDYDILEVFAEYRTKLMNLPLSVFGNYAQNTVATTQYDTGWLIGGKINKAKAPGSWEFFYTYRDLEADAVLATYTDGDFVSGGIGGSGAIGVNGHKCIFVYQIAKGVQAAFTYYYAAIERSSSELDYRRLNADIKLKF